MSALRPGSGGGAARPPQLGDIRELYTTALPLTSAGGWTLLTPAAGASAAFEAGGLGLSIPAGVESTGHVGAYRASAFARSSTFSALVRLHARNVNNTAWERFVLRIGADANNCGAVILSGAGSLDIGYFDGGGWNGTNGRGGNADVRTPYAAGELVLVLRRTPTYAHIELYSGATIDDALNAGPYASIGSGDATMLRRFRDGQFVRLEAQTIGPVGTDVDIIVAEAAVEVGGAT